MHFRLRELLASSKIARTIDILLVLIVLGFGSTVLVRFIRPDTEPYRPAPLVAGEELVFVFLGSSTCPGTRLPGVDSAVKTLMANYRGQAAAENKRFVAIGVSLDWQFQPGLDLLNRFGNFDEVMIGRSWLNSGIVKYVWDELPGYAAIPQIVLLTRTVSYDDGYSVSNQQVLVRRTGADALKGWAAAITEKSRTNLSGTAEYSREISPRTAARPRTTRTTADF